MTENEVSLLLPPVPVPSSPDYVVWLAGLSTPARLVTSSLVIELPEGVEFADLVPVHISAVVLTANGELAAHLSAGSQSGGGHRNQAVLFNSMAGWEPAEGTTCSGSNRSAWAWTSRPGSHSPSAAERCRGAVMSEDEGLFVRCPAGPEPWEGLEE
jgi:hypothetical protein